MLEFNIGGRPTRTQCQYTLQDANLDDLNQWSSKIFDKLKTIPELRDVATGSSFDRAAFVALIGKGRATMMFTDPPYNVPIHDHVPIHGHASGLGAVHHRPFPMASSEMDGAQFTRFLGDAFRNLAVFSVDGSIHFVCMDWRHLEELLVAGHGVYGEVKNLCVRVKDNAGMGSLYRSRHELVLVFTHGRREHRNNVQFGRFGRNRSNVSAAYDGQLCT